jgi:hypothetical protein
VKQFGNPLFIPGMGEFAERIVEPREIFLLRLMRAIFEKPHELGDFDAREFDFVKLGLDPPGDARTITLMQLLIVHDNSSYTKRRQEQTTGPKQNQG